MWYSVLIGTRDIVVFGHDCHLPYIMEISEQEKNREIVWISLSTRAAKIITTSHVFGISEKNQRDLALWEFLLDEKFSHSVVEAK